MSRDYHFLLPFLLPFLLLLPSLPSLLHSPWGFHHVVIGLKISKFLTSFLFIPNASIPLMLLPLLFHSIFYCCAHSSSYSMVSSAFYFPHDVLFFCALLTSLQENHFHTVVHDFHASLVHLTPSRRCSLSPWVIPNWFVSSSPSCSTAQSPFAQAYRIGFSVSRLQLIGLSTIADAYRIGFFVSYLLHTCQLFDSNVQCKVYRIGFSVSCLSSMRCPIDCWCVPDRLFWLQSNKASFFLSTSHRLLQLLLSLCMLWLVLSFC